MFRFPRDMTHSLRQLAQDLEGIIAYEPALRSGKRGPITLVHRPRNGSALGFVYSA